MDEFRKPKRKTMTDAVVIEASLKQAVETFEGSSFDLLILIKDAEEPDLLQAFLEGLCKPYERVAFFLYKDAIQIMEKEDCEGLLACFKRMADEGLRVFVANESLTTYCPGWSSCCSMRDLPLLIQEAIKVVSL